MSQKIMQSELKQMSPIQLVEDDRIQTRFVKIVDGITRSQMGAQIYEREKQWFVRIISENPELRNCSPVSIFSAFMDVATLGLSVAQGTKPLAYLIPYNVTVGGTKQNPIKEKRVQLEVSPYGELAMRKHFGQIKDVDNPVIVYEDDEYEEGVKDGKRYVTYKKNMKSTSRRIKAGFIKIVKPNDEIDYFTMDMQQVERLAGYSERKNFGKTNKLYTSNNGQIDEGFFAAKIIKHAFSSYPKAPFMQTVKASFQTDKEEEFDITKLVDIGVDTETGEIHPDNLPAEEAEAEDVTDETATSDSY